MATLPRGIQAMPIKDKRTKSITVKYRVQVRRQGFTADKLFDVESDAVMFWEDSRTPEGRLAITRGDDRSSARSKAIAAEMAEIITGGRITVGKAIDLYNSRRYQPILDNPKSEDKDTRSAKTMTYLLNSIRKVKIGYMKSGLAPSGVFSPMLAKAKGYDTKALQDFSIDELTSQHVTELIEKRLDGGAIQVSSVRREIGALQSIVNKLEHYDNTAWLRLKSKNPFKSYDKSLLKGGSPRRRNIIDDNDSGLLVRELVACRNPDMLRIYMISMLTGMRRAESIGLKWSQIHLEDGYIELSPTDTKARKERIVILLKDAHDFIKDIPRVAKRDRLFKYTIEGFKSVFDRVIKRTELEDVKFHDTRRSAITKVYKELTSSSVALADMFGVANVRNFEDTTIGPIKTGIMLKNKAIRTQEEAQQVFGHKDAQTTLGYMNIAGVKKKKGQHL
jgi:integrase